MGIRVHFTLLPLSRAVREAGRDPDSFWRALGMEEWIASGPMREVAARNPGLVDVIRRNFREAFLPDGSLRLEVLISLNADPEEHELSAGDVRFLREHQALCPFWNETPEGSSYSWAFLWILDGFESLGARELWDASDGQPSGPAWVLHGVDLRPPEHDLANLIPASVLEGTNLDDLRNRVFRDKIHPYDTEEHAREAAFFVDGVIGIIRRAKEHGLDVVALQP